MFLRSSLVLCRFAWLLGSFGGILRSIFVLGHSRLLRVSCSFESTTSWFRCFFDFFDHFNILFFIFKHLLVDLHFDIFFLLVFFHLLFFFFKFFRGFFDFFIVFRLLEVWVVLHLSLFNDFNQRFDGGCILPTNILNEIKGLDLVALNESQLLIDVTNDLEGS